MFFLRRVIIVGISVICMMKVFMSMLNVRVNFIDLIMVFLVKIKLVNMVIIIKLVVVMMGLLWFILFFIDCCVFLV